MALHPLTLANVNVTLLMERSFPQRLQFCLGNNELRVATIQTNHKFGEYPDNRHVHAFQSKKVNGNLSPELLQVF